MDWLIGIAMVTCGVVVASGAIWLERRPRDKLMPTLVPTTPVMFAGIVIVVLGVAYLLATGGIKLPSR